MPAGAVWTAAEETALVDFLVDNQAEAGDGGNFKTTTFQRAVSHIATFHERGPVKTVKSTRNKWVAFRKLYRIIRAIQSVSGWVWDDETGASITADSASSWDDYVKKHPEAKPFRNKGWKHFNKVAQIMPSTPAGANVFHPTTGASAPDNASAHSSSPEPTPPPVSSDPQDVEDSDLDEPPPAQATSSRKRAREPTPSRSAPKRVRASHGAAALQSMSASLVGFGTAISAALAPPPAPVVEPSPLRRTNAVAAVLRLEADWLTLGQQVALIDFLRDDRTAADIYTALTEPDVRKEWVRIQLERLGVMVF